MRATLDHVAYGSSSYDTAAAATCTCELLSLPLLALPRCSEHIHRAMAMLLWVHGHRAMAMSAYGLDSGATVVA